MNNCIKVLYVICTFLSLSCSSKKSNNGKTISVAEANKLQAQGNVDGDEITVQGYVWGVRDMNKGEKVIALGDEKLSGAKVTTFLCKFTKENAAQTEDVKRDALIVVSGKIGKGYGGAELTESKIVAIKE